MAYSSLNNLLTSFHPLSNIPPASRHTRYKIMSLSKPPVHVPSGCGSVAVVNINDGFRHPADCYTSSN